ncbi:AMP-binding protein [Micromonospora sp. CPCC 206061]|uniref:AMP-binding protein n=1 Tax=Micromonospora sp. CPCC 206061 TaxID=3122410 RepID=UPI002FEEAB46
MAGLLAGTAREYGGEPALRDARGARTWAQLDERVNRWIAVLRGLGLSTGDCLAMALGNRRETVEALLACLHAGVVAVPVNWHLTPREMAAILADSGSVGVLADDGTAPAVAAARQLCPAPPRFGLVTGDVSRSGLVPVEPLLAGADPAEPADQHCGTVMMYTSGSTGSPKGVRNNLFRLGAPLRRVSGLLEYAGAALRVPRRRPVLHVGPWYHSAQLFFLVMPLLRGCPVLLHERFDPAATLAAIEGENIAVCHLVPAQMVRLLALPEPVRRAFDGSRLELVWHGGGPCPAAAKRRMIDWWGPVFLEYYGATEGGVATLIDSAEWLRRPGSVGRAATATEILVVDDNDRPVPPGVVGRVFLRRASRAGFEYHNAPDETRRAHLAPGVFTYGELGYLDEDGYLFLTGRAKDMIVSGSVNIYPAELEAVLLSHPAVRDAAVVGVPDEVFGERPLAVVELRPGALAEVDAPAALERHCRESLAGFKVPRVYRVTAALPRDPSGKLSKRLLREQYGRHPT